MGEVSTYVAQAGAAIRMSWADRTNFALQCGGMIVNNGFVLLLWFMFFAGFKSVGGWRLPDMALLMGLVATIVGLAGTLCGGYRDLAAQVLRGDPDLYLAQPKAVLPRMLAAESSITGWGDLATGLVLLILAAGLSPADAPWLAVVLATGVVVYAAMGVAFASLAFWLRGARSFSRDLVDFALLFCSYPGAIFTGPLKLVVFTVFPAGFIVFVPVSFLRAPSLSQGLVLIAAAAGYAALAAGLFHLGLRRYRQGDAPAFEG